MLNSKGSQPSIYGGSYVLTTDLDNKTGGTDKGSSVCNPFSGREDLLPKGSIREDRHDPGVESKRKMNIIDDADEASRTHSQSRSAIAETEVDDQPGREVASLRNQNFLAIDETMNVRNDAIHHLREEGDDSRHLQQSSWRLQDRKNELLRQLESQNAEALKAIQHENSTFIQMHSKFGNQLVMGQQAPDTSYYSADLRHDLRTLEQMPLSEFQTTTIHEVNNDSLQCAPRFIEDGVDES